MNEPNPGDSHPPERPTSSPENFSITVDEKYASVSRSYFAQDPSGEFSKISEARKGGFGIELTKIGRKIPFGERYKQEEESIFFFADEEFTHGVMYTLKSLKGQMDFNGMINNIDVRFTKEGEFESFSGDIHDSHIETSFGFTTGHLAEHFRQNKSPFIRQSDGSAIVCEDDGNFYVMYLIADTKPQHKVIVKKKIDSVEDLMDDLGVKSLIENPLQPAHGVEGKSHGDDLWRYDNFADRMGVHVIPIDNPDEVEEFDRKGFRALVASIAKQV